MPDRPQVRTEGIITERVANELVIYDGAGKMAHCLSAGATAVWAQCEGRLSCEEIAVQLNVEPGMVAHAVDELDGWNLLEHAPAAARGYSRREVAKRFAKVGGAAVAAPLIYSVAIGSAAAAASAACTANCPNGAPQTLAQCPASLGFVAFDTACTSFTCYNNAGTRTCVAGNCLIKGLTCPQAFPCCSGSCNGVTHVCN